VNIVRRGEGAPSSTIGITAIFNSKGVRVGVVTGDAVFGLKGQKLYDLKGSNIYKLNGDLVGHLSDARGKEKRLDKTTDKLFPEG
jgi:hypothetical protein